MSNLVLPGIEPARVGPSAADAFDEAGAKFKAAADDVSGLMYEMELADIEVQTQEADNALKKDLNDTIDAIKSQPYVTPKDVEGLFGGNVPESIKLTDEAGNRRAVIPMHEIARDLFERRSNESARNAAQGIKHGGWRAKFERGSAAARVESARGEAYDWQRAQRMADLEIRSVSGYEQAMRARDYEGALGWLNNKAMSPTTREKLIAEHPTRKVEQDVLDSIRTAQEPEELDKVLSGLNLNAYEEGISLDEGTQARFAGAARERKHQIIAEKAAEAKRQYKARLEVVGDKVEKAVALAEQTGRPAFTFYPAGELLADERASGGFDEADMHAFFQHLDSAGGGGGSGSSKAEPSEAGWRVYARFGDLQRQKKLKDIPVTEMLAAKPLLGNKWTEVFGWWRAAKDGEEDGKGPSVRPEVSGWIKNFLEGALKRKPEKDDPDQYLSDIGRANSAVQTWEKANNKPIDPDNLRTLLASTFQGAKTKNAATAVLNRELPRINGRAYVTPQDFDIAAKGMAEQKALVDEAWEGMIESRELDDGLRAEVYVLTQNKTDRAILEEYLRAQVPPKPVNPRTLVWAAVKTLQHPADYAYEKGRAAKATRESESRQIKAAGAEQAAVRAEIEGVDEAAARQVRPAGAPAAAPAGPRLPSFRESDQPKKPAGSLYTESRVKGFMDEALEKIGDNAYNALPVTGEARGRYTRAAALERADAARAAAQPGLEAAVRAALPAWTAYRADYLAGKVPRMEFGEWFAQRRAQAVP